MDDSHQTIAPIVPPITATINTSWTKRIPRINLGFMIVSLALVFILDLGILISSPALISFWLAMLVGLGIFGVLFYLENFVYSKRFANSFSKLDSSLSALIIGRNLIFILNFIPIIQIIGLIALIFLGLPILIIYIVLINLRTKAVNSVV